jgi:hypothetical protein
MTKSEANPSGTYHERVLAFRRALIRDAIRAAGGNKSRAARVLGLQRTYLLRLVRELDLRDPLSGARRSPRTVGTGTRVSRGERLVQPRGRPHERAARGSLWPDAASETPGVGASGPR